MLTTGVLVAGLGACTGATPTTPAGPATSGGSPSASGSTGSPTSPATPTTPQVTSATSTASVAAGTLIPYPNGVDILTAADTAKLTGAPEDFKGFLAGQLDSVLREAGNPTACRSYVQIGVQAVHTGGYASGHVAVLNRSPDVTCISSGNLVIWVRKDGAWRQLASTGDVALGCAVLEEAGAPSAVAGPQCYDGATLRPYQHS